MDPMLGMDLLKIYSGGPATIGVTLHTANCSAWTHPREQVMSETACTLPAKVRVTLCPTIVAYLLPAVCSPY